MLQIIKNQPTIYVEGLFVPYWILTVFPLNLHTVDTHDLVDVDGSYVILQEQRTTQKVRTKRVT